MAFKFNVDAGGNLVVDAKKEAMQTVAATSGFGMSVDESGNLVTSSPDPSQMAVDGTYDQSKPPLPDTYGAGQPPQQEPYQTVIPSPAGPDTGLGGPERDITWAEIRDPFTGELRETAESRNLPETTPISAASYTKGINDVKSIASMLLAADDEGRVTALKSLIPGLETQKDSGGNIIMTYPDGKQEVLNKPGFSEADAYQLAFDTALFLPGGLAAAPIKGAIKKGVVGAIGAGLTETLRQQGSKATGTGEKTSIPRIATAAAGGMLAESVPAVISGKGRAAKKLNLLESETKGVKGAIEEGLEASKALDVDLFPAQITKAPSAAGKQEVLQKLNGSSQKALDALKTQDEQLGRAVENVLETISPAKTIDEAPAMVRDAAKKAVERKLSARSNAANKWYKKAFQNKEEFELPKTIGKVEELKKSFKPDSDSIKWLEKIEKKFKKGNIEQHHGTKKEIDGMFGKFGTESALDGNQKKMLTEIKQEFLGELKTKNKNYEKARKIFSSESPNVDKINKSYLGKVAKMDDFDADKLDAIVPKLFKPRTTDRQVRQFRKIIMKENPEAWRAITRRRFEDLLTKKGYENPETVYTALFANKANKRQLYAALDKESAKRVKYLEVVSERAKIGRFKGTDTATKTKAIEDVDKGGFINTAAGGLTPFNTAKNWMQGMGTEYRREALADVMFNPKWNPDWAALRKLTPGTTAAAKRLNSMLRKSEAVIKSASKAQSTPEKVSTGIETTRKVIDKLTKD